ncbi:MAG: T9SS type A sorting domain-containing protein [Saprospiraceae bacterium]|nr:T9SS type A sorting domain-containing protein [Saprospiraceae bacterium]
MIKQANLNVVHIFPNPLPRNTTLTLFFQPNLSGWIWIELRNLAGETVFEDSFSHNLLEQYVMDLKGLSRGIYVLYMRTSKEFGIQRLAIL